MSLQDNIAEVLIHLIPFEEITVNTLARRAGAVVDDEFAEVLSRFTSSGALENAARGRVRKGFFSVNDLIGYIDTLRTAKITVRNTDSITQIVIALGKTQELVIDLPTDQVAIDLSNSIASTALSNIGRTLLV